MFGFKATEYDRKAAGVLKIDVKDLGVDLMSMSAHKIYGPKGVGALYVRNGVKLDSILTGGHQERSKRGGTTNVVGIVGFAEAFKIVLDDYKYDFKVIEFAVYCSEKNMKNYEAFSTVYRGKQLVGGIYGRWYYVFRFV